MKKKRPDSKIDKLPENQREALERWLFEENVSYDEALSRLFNDFNVRVSRSTLFGWRSGRAEDRLLDRIVVRAQRANAVVSKFEENPAETLQAISNLASQAVFEKQASGEELPLETVKDIGELAATLFKIKHDAANLKLKEKDLELKGRRVALLEKKAAQAEAAEGTLKDTTLSPEEQQNRLKEIFGIK